MRLRNIPGAKEAIESSRYVVHEVQEKKENGILYLEMKILSI